MIILPAIDIRSNKVVRLLQGDFTKETIYSGDPLNMAVRWEREGAKMLHVVDLDGAFSGKLVNLAVIKQIAKAVKIPVELGGGLRSEKDIDKAFDCGVKRVVVGTKAYKDENFLKRVVKKYAQNLAISIDAGKGDIASEGWKAKAPVSLQDFINKINAVGVNTVIYTDILKDGTMQGPNIEAISQMADKLACNLIASGGISSLNDIKAVKDLNKKNIAGIIVGKALYEGAFTLKQANEEIE